MMGIVLALAIEQGEPPRPVSASLAAPVVEVPMDLASGRPVVELRLEGKGPYRFILDTGAGSTVVDAALARELGLRAVGETRLGDPSDPEALAAQMVYAESLVLGGVALSGVTMAAFDVRSLMGASYGGILGLPDLEAFLVTLDYPRGRVRMERGELDPGAAGVVAYDSPDGIISLPLRVDGRVLTAHLDSGNPGGFMLPRAVADSVALLSGPVEIGRAQTVNSESVVWLARLRGDIQVGGLTYAQPEVHLSDLLDRWANIGFEQLRELAVTVDQRNRRLRLERTGTAAPPARRRLGFMLAGLRIEKVLPGSLAESAGLRPGDVLASINGRAAEGMAPGEMQELLGGVGPLEIRLSREGEPVTVTIERGG